MTHQNTSTHYNDDWINIDLVSFDSGYGVDEIAVLTNCKYHTETVVYTNGMSDPVKDTIKAYSKLFDDIFCDRKWNDSEKLKAACIAHLKLWFSINGVDTEELEEV